MSQWAREHPEQMAEIAALPLPGQRAALADAQRQSPSQERAETLRNASRAAERTKPLRYPAWEKVRDEVRERLAEAEELDRHDDLRKDAEDDIAIEHEENA